MPFGQASVAHGVDEEEPSREETREILKLLWGYLHIALNLFSFV